MRQIDASCEVRLDAEVASIAEVARKPKSTAGKQQSSRADITEWRFTNEYHYGSFRGDVDEMLRRGYDVHLHFANFGVRKIAFRLPQLPCDKKLFNRFLPEYGVDWTKDKRGKAGILTVQPEADGGSYDYFLGVDKFVDELKPVRQMLLDGDIRPLLYFWLACADYWEDTVPPVPAGLKDDHKSLEDLADFYEITHDAIEPFCKESALAPKQSGPNVNAWIKRMKKAELQELVTELLSPDSQLVRRRTLQEMREQSTDSDWPVSEASFSAEELRYAMGIVTDVE